MKVLILGHYSIEVYSRGRVLYKGLKKNGVDVDIFLCREKLKYFKIAKRILKCDYDVIIATGVTTLLISKLLSRKPIILDALNSNYDTMVFDRKIVPENSLKAKLLWLGDKISFKFADKIIVDTSENKEFFAKEFNINENKFKEIFIGADEDIFYPLEVKKDTLFNVTFVGSFIPLQGVEYIIKSAKILEKEDDILFHIAGEGQTYPGIKKLSKELKIKNVKFYPWQKIEEVPKLVAKADICLGIFGNTPKAKRVVANKVYESLAMKKCVLTGDAPPMRRLFEHKENIFLCKVGDESSLSKSILFLKENPRLREKIAKNGYRLFKEKFSSEVLGEELKKMIKDEIIY